VAFCCQRGSCAYCKTEIKIVVAAFVALTAVFVTDNTDKDVAAGPAARADKAEMRMLETPHATIAKPRQEPLAGSVRPQDRKRLTSSLFD
jgi:hypothetical protein